MKTNFYDKISLNSYEHDKYIRKILWWKKTHVSYSVTFFRKSCFLWDTIQKYGRTGQTTDDSI